MKNLFLLAFIVTSLLFGCNNQPAIEGLWVVKLVRIEDQEMTPNARWTRFNSDFTQKSGNGWLQHSLGTWALDDQTNELKIINNNGLNDPYEPFNIRIENNLMYWNRIEDGQKVQITLERSNQLPKTFGDKILGLWQLESSNRDGKYFKKQNTSNNSDYIFFRWDKRFVINSELGRINGVYNVNGHKPEVELIPYGKILQRDFWTIHDNENTITLTLLNSDSLVERTFSRIHEFPE